jgi:L-ascorbate metabolism protein UlaG (beta-lactamase superfamily)
MMQLKFLGHAGFQLIGEGSTLLFDPFLTGNPLALDKQEDLKANYILVSHAHQDHLGDTVEIATRTGALVISTYEVANLCGEKGAKIHPAHIGGKVKTDFGYVRLTQAFHGAGVPGGHACGFVVNFEGVTIYFAGDTGIFGDMELLGRLEEIDYALLPIGDNFTMGPDDALEAVRMLKPKKVIPMHYNTWPPIEQDPQAFKHAVERETRADVIIMKPGKEITI